MPNLRRIKCYINARFLTQSTTGVQRAGMEIVKALDRIIEQETSVRQRFDFCMLAPRDKRHELSVNHIPLRLVGRFTGHPWEQIELPWHTRDGLLISLCNASPIIKRNQMVTIHDVIAIAVKGTCSFAFRNWYRILVPMLGKTACRIVTDSEFSKADLTRHAGVLPDKIRVIPLGREHVTAVEPDRALVEEAAPGGRPYFLAVSSLSPHKNFRVLVQAVELMEGTDFRVVIAGGTNPRVFSQESISLPETVRQIGHVSDQALRALYENAIGLVFPSLYEGFGLPPVEAMACGCPVVASSIEAVREVCDDAALYFDPRDPRDIAEKMHRIAHDKSLRDELIRKGYERARQYSWEKTARQYLEELSKLADTYRSGAPK